MGQKHTQVIITTHCFINISYIWTPTIGTLEHLFD